MHKLILILLLSIFLSSFLKAEVINKVQISGNKRVSDETIKIYGNINLKKCNTGNPNKVDNPLFKLSNVPEGTKILQFRMKDKNAPGYNHGGGKVEYSGQNTIEPGAFKYKSPCPPGGVHTYVWTVTAKNEKKK